ncbi:MAG TPA: Clp1/GlmU family protein [Actinomycetota bacterium]|nr:Clp1/GlmU family protein [Actinomycetota bacterium]
MSTDPLAPQASLKESPEHMLQDHEVAYERLLSAPGVVFLLGAIDTGKTTFGIELLKRARAVGIEAGLVDADVGQSTVGPPTTVGLKLAAGLDDIGPDAVRAADALAFVGSITPRGHLLSLVTATVKLVLRARAEGCRLVIVDTTGFLSGIGAQRLKFAKMELVKPDHVVAFTRGGELDPILGIVRRFTPAEMIQISVSPDVLPRTVDERAAFREQRFAGYFATGTSRWRVKPTVFMPTLPPEFDLALLDGLVVGMEDGKGDCRGIGVLEFDTSEEVLRMVSPIAEGVRGLRLGSIRIDVGGRSRGPVDLRELFHTE